MYAVSHPHRPVSFGRSRCSGPRWGGGRYLFRTLDGSLLRLAHECGTRAGQAHDLATMAGKGPASAAPVVSGALGYLRVLAPGAAFAGDRRR